MESHSATTPAASESIALSVSICRMIRPRPAPRAERMAISRVRRDALASSRLARLAQAMSRTNPTTAMRIAVTGTSKLVNSGRNPHDAT